MRVTDVNAADVGAFEGIAAKAAQGEITGDGRAAVLLRSDVVDLEGAVIEFLGELAVFTAAIGPADFPDEGCIHAGSQSQEAVRFLGFTPSVRRAFDFRMARTSPALPKSCISFFSAGVSSSF